MYLFVFAPLCYPVSPYMSAPILASILNENGYMAECSDLNALFWDEQILNKEYITKRFKTIKQNIEEIENSNFSFSNAFEEYFIKHRFNSVKDFLEKNDENIKAAISFLDEAKYILKSETEFYNYKKFKKAYNSVRMLQHLLLNSFFVSDSVCKKIESSYEILEKIIPNRNINPYYDYFLNKIKSGEFDKYKMVLISHTYSIQTLSTFTLAYLLKQHTNIKVCLGGNFISRLSDTIKEKKEILINYFDYAHFGVGEEAIVDFIDYTVGKKEAENIQGLVYLKDGEIELNTPATFLKNVRKRPKIDFKGIDFSKYLTPEIIYPFQVSKGCPWGKCIFCVFHYGKTQYQIIPPKQAAEEIKYMQETFGINKFEFVDETLSPQYFYEFAKEIIKLKLNVKYYAFARFDEGFTPEILEKMKESGFLIFEWGYETPSKRIMEIYNKGIDPDSRLDILKKASDAGLWNYCLTMIDIPFETPEEEMYDVEIYEKNMDIMHSRRIAPFTVYKDSFIEKNYEKFNIKRLKRNGDLSLVMSYEIDKQKDKEQDRKAQNMQVDLVKKLYSRNGLIYEIIRYAYDEFLFLYVAKYGKDKCLSEDSNFT